MSADIQREISRRWRRIHARLRMPKAQRVPAEMFATQSASDQVQISAELLNPWLAIFDEGFRLVYLLFYLTHHQRFEVRPGNPSFLILVGRSLNLLAATRHLIVAGFDQAARPLVRSMVENIDLAVSVLHDSELADEYVSVSDDDRSAQRFWRKVVANGKIYARVERIAETLGLQDSESAWLTEHRRAANNVLSQAVHSSLNAAMLSTFVPSINSPEELTMNPLGEISVHAPALLDFVAKEIQVFGSIVLKLITQDTAPEPFRTVDPALPLFQSFVVAVMLLQEIISCHGEEIYDLQARVSATQNVAWNETDAPDA